MPKKPIFLDDCRYMVFDISGTYLDSGSLFEHPTMELHRVVLSHCRHSKIDPMYCSTENWKTLTQWEALGYRYPYGDLPTYGLIYGYTSSACKERCVRIHRSLVRKK